jgi:hypothetical protein
MIKSLAYGLTICATLSALVVVWITKGFKDFGASEGKPLMPVFWGIILFALVFQPILISDFVIKRLRSMSYWRLFARAFCAGAIIYGIWACLYYAGLKLGRYEFVLIVVGWGLGLGVATLALSLPVSLVGQRAAPNGGPAATVEKPSIPDSSSSVH